MMALRARVQPIARAAATAAREAEKSVARVAYRQARPWLAPGLTNAEKLALRYRHDPEYNLRQRLKTAMRRKRQGWNIGDKLRAALKRSGHTSVADWLGYSVADLRAHLERQFTKGMSWERFAAGDIHIDHIVALTKFDLSNEDELRAAWALTNLRPLWAEDNLRKGAQRTHLL